MIICDKCKKTQDDLGGQRYVFNEVVLPDKTIHLCDECYDLIIEVIDGSDAKKKEKQPITRLHEALQEHVKLEHGGPHPFKKDDYRVHPKKYAFDPLI